MSTIRVKRFILAWLANDSARYQLGMNIGQAEKWLSFLQRPFTFLPDREEITSFWRELVVAHQVAGFRAHDLRLVAAMQSYGINRLMTFNGRDFKHLPITVIDPLQS